jgi:hypothetical protein
LSRTYISPDSKSNTSSPSYGNKVLAYWLPITEVVLHFVSCLFYPSCRRVMPQVLLRCVLSPNFYIMKLKRLQTSTTGFCYSLGTSAFYVVPCYSSATHSEIAIVTKMPHAVRPATAVKQGPLCVGFLVEKQ